MARASATLFLDIRKRTHVISPWLHGGCIENAGESIYGGIWINEGSNYSKHSGLRTEVMDALKRSRLGLFRWPGGITANFYHWTDGIGPRSKRKRRVPAIGKTPETNQFGTHEFMDLCDKVGTQRVLVLNLATGSVQEALDWAEYCNSTDLSEWVQERKLRGSPHPFHVENWQLGEQPWKGGGNLTPEQYGERYIATATLLKTRMPSARLFACLHRNPDWNQRFLQILKSLSLSSLLNRAVIEFEADSSLIGGGAKPQNEEEYFGLFSHLADLEVQIIQTLRLLERFIHAPHPVPVMLGRWGIRHPGSNPGTVFHQINTLRDGLFAACLMHILFRFPDVDMACIAYPLNSLHALLMTHKTDIIRTPTGHALDLLKDHLCNKALPLTVHSPKINLGRAWHPRNIPIVDGFASLNSQEQPMLSLVNLHPEKSIQTTIHLKGATIESAVIRTLTANNVLDQNTFLAPHQVEPVESPRQKTAVPILNLPPHSLSQIVMTLKP
ncbi:MAG TPA: hypothetical protein ENN03_11480 [bacterium]|nr:hypothetical protein [bacterium]